MNPTIKAVLPSSAGVAAGGLPDGFTADRSLRYAMPWAFWAAAIATAAIWAATRTSQRPKPADLRSV